MPEFEAFEMLNNSTVEMKGILRRSETFLRPADPAVSLVLRADLASREVNKLPSFESIKAVVKKLNDTSVKLK